MKDQGLRIERSKLYLSRRIKSREFEKGWWVLKQGFCKIRRRRSDFFRGGFERDGWGERWSWEDNKEGVDLGRSDRWIAGRGLKIRGKWEEEKGGGGLGEERRRNGLSKDEEMEGVFPIYCICGLWRVHKSPFSHTRGFVVSWNAISGWGPL